MPGRQPLCQPATQLYMASTGLVDHCDGSEQRAAVNDGKKPRYSPSKKYSGLVSASA